MKETLISLLALVLALHLFLVSADRLSLPHLPINETFQGIVGEYSYSGRCGRQGLFQECPNGMCCSKWGWCGTTLDYCSPKNCQSQCEIPSPPPPPPSPSPPPPPSFPPGRCGNQAAGRKCPNGMCCSKYGWCGVTLAYCSPKYCQSQCIIRSPPPPPPPSFPQGPCGNQAAGTKCPTGLCCNKLGWCGTTSAYCAPENCQSQCETTPTYNPMESFYFNVV